MGEQSPISYNHKGVSPLTAEGTTLKIIAPGTANHNGGDTLNRKTGYSRSIRRILTQIRLPKHLLINVFFVLGGTRRYLHIPHFVFWR